MTTYREYRLPSIGIGEGWALFVLGDNGFISFVSDYKNGAYLFAHHGQEDARLFFLNMHREMDYFANKFGWQKEYDSEKTFCRLKEIILEKRRSRSIEKEYARELWDSLVGSSIRNGTEYDLNTWLEDYGYKYNGWVFNELMIYSWPIDVQNFFKKLCPRFVEILEKELEADGYVDSLP